MNETKIGDGGTQVIEGWGGLRRLRFGNP